MLSYAIDQKLISQIVLELLQTQYLPVPYAGTTKLSLNFTFPFVRSLNPRPIVSNMWGIIYHNFVIKFRCDNAGENGITRLASVKCPTGLAFDIERQTCDWKTNVKNCDSRSSKCWRSGDTTINNYQNCISCTSTNYYVHFISLNCLLRLQEILPWFRCLVCIHLKRD